MPSLRAIERHSILHGLSDTLRYAALQQSTTSLPSIRLHPALTLFKLPCGSNGLSLRHVAPILCFCQLGSLKVEAMILTSSYHHTIFCH